MGRGFGHVSRGCDHSGDTQCGLLLGSAAGVLPRVWELRPRESGYTTAPVGYHLNCVEFSEASKNNVTCFRWQLDVQSRPLPTTHVGALALQVGTRGKS